MFLATSDTTIQESMNNEVRVNFVSLSDNMTDKLKAEFHTISYSFKTYEQTYFQFGILQN